MFYIQEQKICLTELDCIKVRGFPLALNETIEFSKKMLTYFVKDIIDFFDTYCKLLNIVIRGLLM
ncbi:MAG: hypothetical protein ONB13_00005, partial [candidate division KSB1 bacterium]|nr:hypothetical protein [candidate division KSB1 bacterium]